MGIELHNYFEDDEYMSVSQFKVYSKCEVKASRPYDAVSNTALLVGSYVDAFVEGTLEQFKAEHPEIISSRGATKGELKSEFVQADEICRYIQSNKRIQQFLSGEKQRIMTGTIGNVPFKIKMDAYSPHIAINDLKVMRSVTGSDGRFIDFITPWRYDLQLSAYQEIVRQNTGERLPVYIVAVTKETPINSVIVNIPQHILDRALYEIESQISHFYDIKMGRIEPVGCGVCNVCVSERSTTPIISLDDILM